MLRTAFSFCIVLSLLASDQALCDPTINLEGSIILDTRFDDNSNRANSSVEEIEERQYVNSAQIVGSYTGDGLSANANYQVARQGFLKDSQEDLTFVVGSSLVSVGNSDQRFYIEAEQNQRRSLLAADQELIAPNTQETSSFSVRPQINLVNKSATIVSLRGGYSETKNEITSDSDSTEFLLDLMRSMSKSRRFGLSISRRYVDIIDVPILDYRYQNIALTFEKASRLSSFVFTVGASELSSDTSSDRTEESFSLEFTSRFFQGDLSISLSRDFDDVTNLNGIQVNEEGLDIVEGVNDQLLLSAGTLSYRTDMLCVRCDMRVSLSYQDLRFLNQSTNTNKTLVSLIGLNYRINRTAEINTTLSRRDVDFLNDNTRGLVQDVLNVTLEKNIVENISISSYIQRTGLSGESREFDRNLFGVRLTLTVD